MQNETGNIAYEVVIDGQGAQPMRLRSDCPAGVLSWAERHNINSAFEIREDGRRLAKVRYLPSHVWMISP